MDKTVKVLYYTTKVIEDQIFQVTSIGLQFMAVILKKSWSVQTVFTK